MTAVRESTPADRAAIEALYPAAFPEEALLALVRDLLDATPGVLSLVAETGGRVAGHVVFTRALDGPAALLGPLAVLPAQQGRGIGSALVRAGLARLAAEGVAHVAVLGDPAYYARFGFAMATRLAPPYALPEDWAPAWQDLALADAPPPAGPLALPPAWMRPEYWTP